MEELPERVDLLVNNAGGNTDFSPSDAPVDPLERLRDAWRANLDANLVSVVLMTGALDDRLADGARVVTIGSIAARQGAGSYGAAKAGVESRTGDRRLGSAARPLTAAGTVRGVHARRHAR